MDDIEHALGRLASADPDRDLAGVEAGVWRGVSAHEAGRRRAALIGPAGAAGVLGAMVLGVAAGGSLTPTSGPPEFEVFSPHAALAPSTLLGAAG